MKHSTTRTQNITYVFRRAWMRVFLMVLLPVILASAAWGQTAAQQTGVPKLVQIKGALRDQDGKPLTGVQGVTFALYKDEHEGAPLWVETQQVTSDNQGRFVALLGAMSAEGLPLELFTSGEAQWLGMQAAGQPEQPRAFLASVPYALASPSTFSSVTKITESSKLSATDRVTTASGPPPAPIFTIVTSPSSGLQSSNDGAGTVTISLVTTCASGQLLKWNGGAWGCTADTDVRIGVTGGGLNVLRTNTIPNIVGGASGNSVLGGVVGATISGGGQSIGSNANQVNGDFGTVGGGQGNIAKSYATVGGGFFNTANGQYATVGGGFGNTALGNYSFAGGNSARALHQGAFVWADSTTVVPNFFSSSANDQFLIRATGGVGIGTNSPTQALDVNGNARASGDVIGGSRLCIGADCRSAWPAGGGSVTSITAGTGLSASPSNPITTTGTLSIATGGVTNAMLLNSSLSVNAGTGLSGGGPVALGGSGTLSVNTSVIQNRVSGSCLAGNAIRVVNSDGTVTCEPVSGGGGGGISGSGTINKLSKFTSATTLGDSQVSDDGANVMIGVSGGGLRVLAVPSGFGPNIIGGFSGNTVTGGFGGATISGGGSGTDPIGISPSVENMVSDSFGTVGGGFANVSGYNATVGGGGRNTAVGASATVGGGAYNTASGGVATVAGGTTGTASGFAATVGGGSNNTASGFAATVPGGLENIAQGDFSFAAGQRGKANHQGAFVWADSTSADFTSTANDQFLIRATGGVGIGKNNPAVALDVNGNVQANKFIGDGSMLTNLPAGGGTITGVTAGSGLTGGGTSGNVSLSIAAGGVTNAMLQNSSLSVNAGTGLSGGGTVALGGSGALSVNTSVIQNRVSGSCLAGNAIRVVNSDGTVTCEPVSGGAGGGISGSGTTNKLSKFTSATTLGDSQVSDDGANVMIGVSGGGLRVLADPTGLGLSPNIIGGFSLNTVTGGARGATISGGGTGGFENTVSAAYGTVGGGFANVSGYAATVGGGSNNTAVGSGATVGGGGRNTASGSSATVGGGGNNTAGGTWSTVGGGVTNTASGFAATVPGGQNNIAQGDYSFAAGQRAQANHQGAFVWADSTRADFASTANDQFLIRATGGVGIGTNSPAPGVALDVNGNARASGDVIGGTRLCIAADCRSAWPAGGGSVTSITAGTGLSASPSNPITTTGTLSVNTFVIQNRVSGNCSGIGAIQTVNSDGTVGCVAVGGGGGGIGGSGTTNRLPKFTAATTLGDSAISEDPNVGIVLIDVVNGPTTGSGGGFMVQASTINSPNIVGGFVGNIANSSALNGGTTISGGGDSDFPNHVTGNYATVGGGLGNTAAFQSTVGGGRSNTASGPSAMVGGGSGNTASGGNAMVPGGQQNTAAGSNSFAAGWVAQANHPGAFVWADSTSGLGFASTANNQFNVRASGGVRIFSNSTLTAGVTLAANGGSWSSVSDRNMKENFAAVDGLRLLEKLSAIPVQTWNYKAQDTSIRHMGPMAQDLYAAFGLGEDDKHISTVDADGVALAAVQALYRLVLQKDSEIRRQQAELQQERQELQALRSQIDQLHADVRAAIQQLGQHSASGRVHGFCRTAQTSN